MQTASDMKGGYVLTWGFSHSPHKHLHKGWRQTGEELQLLGTGLGSGCSRFMGCSCP